MKSKMRIPEMNFETYNGVLLDSREATVLRAIEEISHEKIPFVHQIPLHVTRGDIYSIDFPRCVTPTSGMR
jgi:hypothetical protein